MKNMWPIYLTLALLLTYLGVSYSNIVLSIAGLLSAITSLILAIKRRHSR